LENKTENRVVFWIQMICLSIGTGIIYDLPYISTMFYEPLQKAYGLTNAQIGALLSTYGVVSFISYFFGGGLADRFSTKKLMVISLIMTGLGGLYFSTIPSYTMLIGVHIWWGVFTSLTYNAAVIKARRLLASSSDQGKAFGFGEAIAGLCTALFATLAVKVFTMFGSDFKGLSAATLFYVTICFVAGILTLIFVKDSAASDSGPAPAEAAKKPNILGLYVQTLKLPAVWLLALICMGYYMAYRVPSSYISPYASHLYGVPMALAALLNAMKNWIKMGSGAVAGFISDKIGVSNTVLIGCVLGVVSCLVFTFIPGNPGLVPMLIVNTALMFLGMQAVNCIVFALMEEGKIPVHITGTAIGIISVLGFGLPEIINPIIGGYILDKYPAANAYQYLFAFAAICMAVALVSALLFRKNYVVKRAVIKQTAEPDLQ